MIALTAWLLCFAGSKDSVSDSIMLRHTTVKARSAVDGSFVCNTSLVECQGVVMSSVVRLKTVVATGETISTCGLPSVSSSALSVATIC
uniref:Secreted protein n=1 Tax=Peronospora matthiolae TaxID=2874970 RepID=A0AAV1UQL4_9STRA